MDVEIEIVIANIGSKQSRLTHLSDSAQRHGGLWIAAVRSRHPRPNLMLLIICPQLFDVDEDWNVQQKAHTFFLGHWRSICGVQYGYWDDVEGGTAKSISYVHRYSDATGVLTSVLLRSAYRYRSRSRTYISNPINLLATFYNITFFVAVLSLNVYHPTSMLLQIFVVPLINA